MEEDSTQIFILVQIKRSYVHLLISLNKEINLIIIKIRVQSD